MTTAIRRTTWAVIATAGVIASLLTFPGGLPWMIAAWLLCFTAFAFRRRPGWLPLGACVTLVAVKNGYWSWPLVLLAAVMLTVAAWRWRRSRRPAAVWNRRTLAASLLAVWAAWLFFAWTWWDGARSGQRATLLEERPVVCVGDSLTSFGYPENLATLITVPVVNQGADGITTSDALKELPALLAAKPQVVVIELGGHDFLHGETRAATKARLQTLIDAARNVGAEVILFEVPRGFMFDPYGGLERELAEENNLDLISDAVIRRLVLYSPYAPPGMWLGADWHLSDDGLHPNGAGNEMMAGAVAEVLERLYGPGVRAGQ